MDTFQAKRATTAAPKIPAAPSCAACEGAELRVVVVDGEVVVPEAGREVLPVVVGAVVGREVVPGAGVVPVGEGEVPELVWPAVVGEPEVVPPPPPLRQEVSGPALTLKGAD